MVFAALSLAEKAVVARALSPATTLIAPVAPDSGLALHAPSCADRNWRKHDEGETFHKENV
jgi:hypothetical protein